MEDQLALAAMHYLRAHYQEAADIYKNIFKNNRKYVALNVYIALCYYKLDYYDVSEEVLSSYLQQFPHRYELDKNLIFNLSNKKVRRH